MSYTSGDFFRRRVGMAHFCNRSFFWLLILAAPFWKAQGQESTLRLRTDIVTLSVCVTDRQNNFVPGLGPQDFEVYEDGIKQDVTFFSDEDIPLNIGILLD